MKRFALFIGIVALVIVLLYVLGYENRVNETPMPLSIATSTDGASTSVAIGATTSTNTPAVKSEAPKKQTDTKKTSTPGLLTSWKSTMTTLFWVGEPADADNAYITNTESYWDEKWQAHYGGVDSPDCRKGYLPCGFTPKENPFYFALPYAEYDANGNLKASVKKIPWYGKDSLQLIKNRWIEVKHAGNTCYAQWEDVGPNGEDDFAYVFGSAAPVNTFGVHAGLDTSPALWKCLQMSDNGVTEWAFVDGSSVPSGPWKDIVTTSGTSWGN